MRKISSIPNIFRIQIQVISDEIYDSLKKDDVERLKGIQSFASSLWTWTNAGVKIFSYLIRRSVEKRKLKEKEEFTLEELIKVAKNKRTIELYLDGFIKTGFIDEVDTNPQGYEGEPKGVMISLSPIWKNVLRRLENKGQETEVFAQGIGSLLSLSILAQQKGKPCGIKLYTALANICDLASNNNGEVFLDECREIFSKEGRDVMRFYQALSEDNQKVKELRFISKNDGKKITISNNALNAHKRFVKVGNKIVRSMYRK